MFGCTKCFIQYTLRNEPKWILLMSFKPSMVLLTIKSLSVIVESKWKYQIINHLLSYMKAETNISLKFAGVFRREFWSFRTRLHLVWIIWFRENRFDCEQILRWTGRKREFEKATEHVNLWRYRRQSLQNENMLQWIRNIAPVCCCMVTLFAAARCCFSPIQQFSTNNFGSSGDKYGLWCWFDATFMAFTWKWYKHIHTRID